MQNNDLCLFKQTELFGDGTYELAPTVFLQLYTLHILKWVLCKFVHKKSLYIEEYCIFNPKLY